MKKLFLFIFIACTLLVNSIAKADVGWPVPNNYFKQITSGANIAGMQQLIDCSKQGMHTLAVAVNAGATATVIVQVIAANPDGTPNIAGNILGYTMLSATSGTAILTVQDTAFAFYNIYSATTGVALTYIAGCR
jgi:hypothetical protein